MTRKQLTGDFMVDYNEETDTTAVMMFRDDRSVTIEIRPIVDQDTRALNGHATSVMYGLNGPSLTRRRDGWTGWLADDTIEREVADAKIEDLITALEWIVGKDPIAANASKPTEK